MGSCLPCKSMSWPTAADTAYPFFTKRNKVQVISPQKQDPNIARMASINIGDFMRVVYSIDEQDLTFQSLT